MEKWIAWFIVLMFVLPICSAEEWDGYFYLDEIKTNCKVIAEYKIIVDREKLKEYPYFPNHPYELVGTSYTGNCKVEVYSVEYSKFPKQSYPRLNKLIRFEKFYPEEKGD